MVNYSNITEVLNQLSDAQEVEDDNRSRARAAHLFIEKPDGQWEPHWWNASDGKPRYTFDQVGPMVDQVAGDLEDTEFGVHVMPITDEASKDDAELLEGMVRSIEQASKAQDIFSMAGRNFTASGFDAWLVKHDYRDADDFDQELQISAIANAIDSVWFGPHKKPDASDAPWAVVLEAIPIEEYEERWPNGSGMSVSEGLKLATYSEQDEVVIVGQLYYIVETHRELLLLSDGRVVEGSKDTLDVLDEWAAEGITVLRRRSRAKRTVHKRLFDGNDWLGPDRETVFGVLPVVPVYGNFKILENKLVYRGMVEKQMDAQRVFNYSKSREIEEGALAPRAKYWMTDKQIQGHEDELATLNTNADPVQRYTADPAVNNPPTQDGGAQINPGLVSISQSMTEVMRHSAGMYDANMGDNPNRQSGIAIERLQERGDRGSNKYFKAMERAVCRTGEILVDAIPRVYDTQRKARVLREDGSFDIVQLYESVADQQTGRMVTIRDLRRGKYDVVCTAGASFKNRQDKTVHAMVKVAEVDPTILQMGADILFNNLSAPGMDILAERKRRELFNAGAIPPTQFTEEEQAEMEQRSQQPQQPDAATILAMAEQMQAETRAASEQRKHDREDFKMALAEQKQATELNLKALSEMAKTLKTLGEAFGVQSVVTPEVAGVLAGQVDIVERAQDGTASVE